jgi:hypothetical protein
MIGGIKMSDFIKKLGGSIGLKILHQWSKITSNIGTREFENLSFKTHPEYRHPVDSRIEKAHKKLWSVLRRDFDLDTLRLCCNISGNVSPYYVPGQVFASDIQRSLCGWQEEIMYISNKSYYNRWYQNDVFPWVYLHNIDGDMYNSTYELVSGEQVKEILDSLQFPVVIKPNIGAMGGANLYFPKNQKELELRMHGNKNYVIQELLHQHEFFAKYNRYGLNTIRVNLYRSVKNNEMHYLHAILRMGKGGGLDNITAGGIYCLIHSNSYLNSYAVGRHGEKYEEHPDSKLKFSEDDKIPMFEEMKKLAITVARDMYFARIISLDMSLDEQSRWRVIEINLNDISLNLAQYGGEPFFGQYTEEIIEYCKNNPWWKKPI